MVVATCPMKYASTTTIAPGVDPNACNIAHRTAASKPQYATAPASRGSHDRASPQASRTASPTSWAALATRARREPGP
jgi:hypothetical protein